MRQERTGVESDIGDAGPDIVPYPSAPLPSTSTILKREFSRLCDRNWLNDCWFACVRKWNQSRRWYDWLARRHHPFRAVFVIATPRSGSNLLVDYLSWLPGVGCLSEVLNWGLPIGPKKFLHTQQAVKHVQQSLQTLRTTHRACKLFLHELEHYRLGIDDLEQGFHDVRYLVLYRENLAEQYVSREIARQTGQWSLLPGQHRKNAAVVVDSAALTRYCQEMRRTYANIADHQAIAQRGAIVSYEQLVSNPARCLREVVCPLLGVPYSEPKSNFCIQRIGSLASRVTNYANAEIALKDPLCQFQLPKNQAGHRSANAG
jgi:LPS sulfotransferase NodH